MNESARMMLGMTALVDKYVAGRVITFHGRRLTAALEFENGPHVVDVGDPYEGPNYATDLEPGVYEVYFKRVSA